MCVKLLYLIVNIHHPKGLYSCLLVWQRNVCFFGTPQNRGNQAGSGNLHGLTHDTNNLVMRVKKKQFIWGTETLRESQTMWQACLSISTLNTRKDNSSGLAGKSVSKSKISPEQSFKRVSMNFATSVTTGVISPLWNLWSGYREGVIRHCGLDSV